MCSTDLSCSYPLRAFMPKALNAAATTPYICRKSPFPSPSCIPAKHCSGGRASPASGVRVFGGTMSSRTMLSLCLGRSSHTWCSHIYAAVGAGLWSQPPPRAPGQGCTGASGTDQADTVAVGMSRVPRHTWGLSRLTAFREGILVA